MSSITYTHLRAELARAMDQVNDDHAPMHITRQNGKGAVLVSADDHASIEETLYLMSSPANATRLIESIERLRQGQGQLRERPDISMTLMNRCSPLGHETSI